MMDIGKEQTPYVIEPAEDPIPHESPAPQPEREREPEKVPA